MSSPPSVRLRMLLQLVGMLRPRGCRLPLLYSAYSVFCGLSDAYCIGGCIAYIILVSGSPMEKLQSIPVCIVILNALMKQLNAVFRQARVHRLLDQFDRIWDLLYEDPDNRMYMNESLKNCNKIFKIYKFVCIYIPILDWSSPIVSYILTGADELHLQILIPIDNKKYFIVAQLTQSLLTMSPFMTNMTQMLLYYVLSEQLSVFMKVLRMKLREEDLSKETIRLHQDVIYLTNSINANYGWILFFETNTVAIECACMAYIFGKQVLIDGNNDAFIVQITNLAFCYATPYIICFCGAKVKTETENIFRDSYNGLWYQGKLQSQKRLKTLMLMSLRPLNWHYKNLVVFGMELFLAIINGTYTFLNGILWLEKAEQA